MNGRAFGREQVDMAAGGNREGGLGKKMWVLGIEPGEIRKEMKVGHEGETGMGCGIHEEASDNA